MAKSPQAKCHLSFAVPERSQLSAYCKKEAHTQPQLADIAALRNILGLGAGAFGAGALLRSIKEVPSVLGPTPSNQVTTGAVGPVEVPIPMDPDQEQPMPGLPKLAEGDFFGTAAKGLYDNVLQPMGLDKADTWQTTTPTAKWWQMPAMLGAGAAAGAGGWKMVDWLADHRRQQAGDTELQNAQQEYENAVKGLHVKAAALNEARETMKKQAGAEGVQPDALFRQPLAPNAMKNLGGLGANTLFGIAALTGIPTAVFAYHHAQNTNDVKALQEALIARRRAQQIRNPAPPHLVLAPQAG